MGKVTCIGTEHGFLSETAAILEYIEHHYPDKPILPSDAFQRAKNSLLMLGRVDFCVKFIQELYFNRYNR
jgi:glutathione S-transferase